jgi:tetratricopeptide (TPR) repeat protein
MAVYKLEVIEKNRMWMAVGFFLLAGVCLAHPVDAQGEDKRGPPRIQPLVEEIGEGKEEDDKHERLLKAFQLWKQGYLYHVIGDYRNAIDHFRASIQVHPTAEGHTFLGWSMSMLGQYKEAIAECKKAIALDPDYGNPYNDIGVYLTALGQGDEAIPWLKKAMSAKRYCCYQFPHFNLGGILLRKGKEEEALRSFEKALEIDPDYQAALEAVRTLREKLRKYREL